MQDLLSLKDELRSTFVSDGLYINQTVTISHKNSRVITDQYLHVRVSGDTFHLQVHGHVAFLAIV